MCDTTVKNTVETLLEAFRQNKSLQLMFRVLFKFCSSSFLITDVKTPTSKKDEGGDHAVLIEQSRNELLHLLQADIHLRYIFAWCSGPAED